MAQVSIVIRGRSYQIVCEDGQEAHLARLGRYLDKRAEEIIKSGASVSDHMLLMMVSLLVADELSDSSGELEDLRAAGKGISRIEAEEEIVRAIEALSARIDSISERLQGP